MSSRLGVAGMGGLYATVKSVGGGVKKDASSHCVLGGVKALVAVGIVESALQEDLATDELLLADGSERDGDNRLAAIKARTDNEWSNEGCGDDCSQRDDFALVHGVTR